MPSGRALDPNALTAAEADHQRAEAKARLAESRIMPPVRHSSGPLAYIAAALILAIVGYILFSGNWTTARLFPTVTETVPSPDINSAVPPAPQTAPPPADAPATNP